MAWPDGDSIEKAALARELHAEFLRNAHTEQKKNEKRTNLSAPNGPARPPGPASESLICKTQATQSLSASQHKGPTGPVLRSLHRKESETPTTTVQVLSSQALVWEQLLSQHSDAAESLLNTCCTNLHTEGGIQC